MSSCEILKFPIPRICTGDLRHRITVLKRFLIAPHNPSVQSGVKATLGFQSVFTVWAAVKMIKGSPILDGVATDSLPTHYFYTRYLDGITNDNWIQLKNDYYRILKVNNLDEDNVYLQIQTVKTGDVAKSSAQI